MNVAVMFASPAQQNRTTEHTCVSQSGVQRSSAASQVCDIRRVSKCPPYPRTGVREVRAELDAVRQPRPADEHRHGRERVAGEHLHLPVEHHRLVRLLLALHHVVGVAVVRRDHPDTPKLLHLSEQLRHLSGSRDTQRETWRGGGKSAQEAPQAQLQRNSGRRRVRSARNPYVGRIFATASVCSPGRRRSPPPGWWPGCSRCGQPCPGWRS